MDGVRLNQPFGDVVSWDLIPAHRDRVDHADAGIESAVRAEHAGRRAVDSDQGRPRHTPGPRVQATLRQRRAAAVEFEHGGRSAAGLHWYLAGNLFGEDGWRDDSPSDVGQLFGKLGWQRAKHDVSLTAAYANNSLTGNGLQEQQFLERDYASVYTKPDITDNRSTFVNRHDAAHRRPSSVTLSGNAYYRDIRDEHAQRRHQRGLARPGDLPARRRRARGARRRRLHRRPGQRRGRQRTRRFPSGAASATSLLNDEPAEKCNGLINRDADRAAQRRRVRPGHAARSGRPQQQPVHGRRRATTGSRVDFAQSTELGYLNPDRSVTGVGAFGDGGHRRRGRRRALRHARRSRRIDPHLERLSRPTRVSIGDAWHLTLSGRYNRTSIRNRDRIQPGGGPGSLDGDHDVPALQSRGRRDLQSVARAQRLCRATAKAAARRRRSSSAAPIPSSPASCRTRWPATRRSSRSSPERSKAGVRGHAPRRRAGTPACSGPETATTSCSSRPTRPASATSRTSARRGGRASSSAPAVEWGASRSAPATRFSTRRSRAKRPSTARATAPTMRPKAASAGSRARSRSSPATGCRSFRRTCSRRTATSRSRRGSRWISI